MIKSITFSAYLLLFLFASSTNTLALDDRSAEVEEYIKGLNSTAILIRIDTAKRISNSAIINTSLYDEVEKKLKERTVVVAPRTWSLEKCLEESSAGDEIDECYRLDALNIQPSKKNRIDEIAWLCKALASSGDHRYRNTLKEVINNTSDSKIRNYATQSHQSFDEFKKRNEILNNTALYDDTLTAEENRIANMIRSEMIKLKRDGAKIVSREDDINDKLYDIINEELLANYQNNQGDNNFIDTMAWFCKALASSKNNKYISTFQEILESASNQKLKNFAKRSLDRLAGRNR